MVKFSLFRLILVVKKLMRQPSRLVVYDIQERLLLGSQGKLQGLHKDLLEDCRDKSIGQKIHFGMYFITTAKAEMP